MPGALSRASVARRVETCELNNRGRTTISVQFRSKTEPVRSHFQRISKLRPIESSGVTVRLVGSIKRFLASGRTGFYLAVTREGDVGAGDRINVIARDPNAVPVSEIRRLYVARRYGDEETTSMQRALLVDALPESWKAYFHERLQRVESNRAYGSNR